MIVQLKPFITASAAQKKTFDLSPNYLLWVKKRSLAATLVHFKSFRGFVWANWKLETGPQWETNFLQEKLSSLLPKLVQEPEGSTDEKLQALAPFRLRQRWRFSHWERWWLISKAESRVWSVFCLLRCTIKAWWIRLPSLSFLRKKI